MRLHKLRECKICKKNKVINEYRLINSINGYLSKTCRACETLRGINLSDDTRKPDGYIYLIFDSAFPNYIKIGYTIEIKERLNTYNQIRPLDTCSYVYISKLLHNIVKLEKTLLRKINTYAYSTPNRLEWFSVDYKEKIIAEIKAAEADINNQVNINLG